MPNDIYALTGRWKKPKDDNSVEREHIIGSGSAVPVRTTLNAKTLTMVIVF